MGDIIHGNKYEFGDGSRMINIQVNIGSQTDNSNTQVLDKELLAQAIENCQQYFWANASYAVVFCICRDEYKMKKSKSDFETMIEDLPYTRKRSYTCPSGTIANAFSNNRIFYENVSDWENFTPLPRIIKLRDELRKALNF